MRGPASAFEALGLAPGADRTTVEQTYRTLMKQYHPDMIGGDAQRAAEINRAYFELRTASEEDAPGFEMTPRPRPLRPQPALRSRPQRRGRKLWLGAAAVLVAAMMLESDRDLANHWSGWTIDGWTGLFARQEGSGPLPVPASLESPLESAQIGSATREALRLSLQGEPDLLAIRSGECHRRLRLVPDVPQLDRCIAFDTAASAILQRDPVQEFGPFGPSAITARSLAAARLLSSDYLAIERRLRLIRTQVEIALLPQAAPAAPPTTLDLGGDGDRAAQPD